MLNCFGSPYGNIGYAVHTRNFFGALGREIPLKLYPLTTNRSGFELDHEIARLLARPLRIDPCEPQLYLASPEQLADFQGDLMVGYTVFEGTDFTENQWAGITNMDYLWVPSRWAKRVLVDKGLAPEKVSIVPEGVNPEIYNSNVSPLEDYYNPDKFTFLSVGKWEPRKAPQELLQVFTRVFEGRDDVRLLLAAENPFHEEIDPAEEIKKMALPDKPEIVTVPRLPDSNHMARLYRSADLFVLFTRAEGWGLPVMEAMACGTPALVTGYGPMNDYMTAEYSFPVEPESLKPIPVTNGYPEGSEHGVWAEPDYQKMAEVMHAAVRQKRRVARMGELAEEKMHFRWSWANAAVKAKKVLERKELI